MLACWVHWTLEDFLMCSAGSCWILWRHFDSYNGNLNPSLRFNAHTGSPHLPVIIGIENSSTMSHDCAGLQGHFQQSQLLLLGESCKVAVSCNHLIAICDLLLASLLTLLVGSQQWSSQKVIMQLQDIAMSWKSVDKHPNCNHVTWGYWWLQLQGPIMSTPCLELLYLQAVTEWMDISWGLPAVHLTCTTCTRVRVRF